MSQEPQELVSLINEFRNRWHRGQGPKWTEFISRLDTPEQQLQLAMLLIPIELDARLERLEVIEPEEDYPSASPELLEVVREQLVAAISSHSTFSADHSRAQSARAGVSQMIGPYKLLQKLGEGGMGEVWMAEQQHPVKRRVALKLIKSGLDNRQVIARFEAERQALAMMDHPNIARVLDAGTTSEGQPFFVMELVHGIPFHRFCDTNQLSIEQRLKLFIPVCHAVQHAHQKGIIHRDLKPSNILVCFYDGQAIPKVIDFGLAKALQPTTRLTDKTMFTELGQVVGTLQYMSPEQAEMNQLDVDTRTDIYSLGVMLYELLTGSTPIQREAIRQQAVLQLLEVIRNHEPPRPSARISSVSQQAVTGISSQRRIEPAKLSRMLRGELDWIVMRALEKDRTRRYETANGLAKDIENFLDGGVVTARPPSLFYQLQKYSKRHLGVVTSLTAIAVLIIAALLVTSRLAWAANREATMKTQALELADTRLNEILVAKSQVEQERDRANSNSLKADQSAKQSQESERLAVAALEQAEAALARSNFLVARSRWAEFRIAEAKEYLSRIPAKYRGFEWYQALTEFRGSYLTLYGHHRTVLAVVFTADSRNLITGGDKTVRIWNSSNGALEQTLSGHASQIYTIAISPDGSRIASGDEDSNVILWDRDSGTPRYTITLKRGIVKSLAFSPDGQLLATATADGSVRLWNADTGQLKQVCFTGGSPVSCVRFHPTGRKLVFSDTDGEIHTKSINDDTNSLDEPHMLSTDSDGINCIAISSDGRLVASASFGGIVRVLDYTTGELIREFSGHEESVYFVEFSPDGSQIASCGADSLIKVWDLRTDQPPRTLAGHEDAVNCVAFTPNGGRLASASNDVTAKIWDLHHVTPLDHLLPDEASEASFSSNGKDLLLTSGSRVTLIDAELQSLNHQWQSASGDIASASLNPSGDSYAVATFDGRIQLLDLQTGQERWSAELKSRGAIDLFFQPNGTSVLSRDVRGAIEVWDVASGVRRMSIESSREQRSAAEFFVDDDHLLVWPEKKGQLVHRWNITENQIVESYPTEYPVLGRWDYCPETETLAVALENGGIALLNAQNGKAKTELLGHAGRTSDVNLSPTGRQLISYGMDNHLRMWDCQSAKLLWSRFVKLDEVDFIWLDFSPDGKRLVVGSNPSNPVLYDCETGEELCTVGIPDSGTKRVSSPFPVRAYFSPHQQQILIEGSKGLLLWTNESQPELVRYPLDPTFVGDASADVTYKWGVDDIVEEPSSEVMNRARFLFQGGTFYLTADDGMAIRAKAEQAGFVTEEVLQEIEQRHVSADKAKWIAIIARRELMFREMDAAGDVRQEAERRFRAGVNLRRHRELGARCEELGDPFGAVFHYAWMMKTAPEVSRHYDLLQGAYEKWRGSSSEDDQVSLPTFVQDALALSRGDGLDDEEAP